MSVLVSLFVLPVLFPSQYSFISVSVGFPHHGCESLHNAACHSAVSVSHTLGVHASQVGISAFLDLCLKIGSADYGT